uniref:N-acetyltransferase domain-containing protein n=1 Tax=Aegilops tauschii subsp. strangulata TaxID=200361 RepID=A0A453IWS6_AEGTS
ESGYPTTFKLKLQFLLEIFCENYLGLHCQSLLKVALMIISFISRLINISPTVIILQVKNDDVTRTVVNSVVGTVDLCVRHPLHGETYPAEPGNTPFYSRIYQPDQPKFGYLTNVCVAKYARRQGIASNMLLLAIDAARLDGAESIYIHVHKDNLPARRLYDHVGFKMVDMDGARQSSDLCLLSFNSMH